MRRGRAVVGAAALLAALGCAERRDGVGFGDAPDPTPPSASSESSPEPIPGNPTPPAGATALPTARVDATALPDGHPRLVWTQDGGRTVGVYGQEGGCSQVRADLLDQTATMVRIDLVETIPTTGPCTMDLRFPPVTVRLGEPLDQRTVVLERHTVGPPR